MIRVEFNGLPSMVWPYVQVVTSSKPLLAAASTQPPALLLYSRNVRIRPAHLRRYREVCGVSDEGMLPPAYLHVLAMPLHMRLFVHPQFPVKVLGLVHLRNVIRQFAPITADQSLTLSVQYDMLRETESGQEYGLVTRAHVQDELVWEEVSTMLARRHTPGKRPSIERAVRDESRMVGETTLAAAANTGRRYAFVSGDFNPIHLFDRTAQAFQFKQCVAHGMWSLARCLGQAQLPAVALELDAQFKLPVYLPSEFVFRQQRAASADGSELTLTTPKGDRLHLLVTVKPLS
jgi:acyl dehydratase